MNRFFEKLFWVVMGGMLCGNVALAEQPNVLVFLMDDMGYGDCRAYNPNSKVSMPHLEQLAAEGMLFTDAHSPSAVCAPTRYSVLTGNYPWRGRLPNGTWFFHQRSQILSGQETTAHLMKRAGYATAFVGKVHLGGRVFSKTTGKPVPWKFDYRDIDFSRRIEQTPASFGFDYAFELPQGVQGPPYVAFENGMLVGQPDDLMIWEVGDYGDSKILKSGFGSPDWDSSEAGPRLTRQALAFIDRHIAKNKQEDKRRPFYMHYCSEACHVPHTPPAELDGTKIRGTAGDAHLDMLFEADVTLGKILQRLQEVGELDNTLILFTSDNGGLSRGKPGKKRLNHNSCEGLRGSKATIWEGGHRVPLIAKWGDGTPTGSVIQPGSRSDAIVGLQDFYATLAELTGQDMAVSQGLDSESFVSALLGRETEPRSSLLVQANDGEGFGQRLMKMVREGPWKLIATKELKPSHLYNLSTDLMETNNLLDDPSQQVRIKRMSTTLQRMMNSERTTVPAQASVKGPITRSLFNLDNQAKHPKKGSASNSAEPNIHVDDLFKPRAELAMQVKPAGNATVEQVGKKWRVRGVAPLKVTFVPQDKPIWNASKFRLIGVPMQNQDRGVTTVDGQLNNSNLTGWSHHAVGLAIAPSGEPVTLGFPFPTPLDRYKGPPVFEHQWTKPNGHRAHWRKFFPEDIRELTLHIKSSTGKIDLLIDPPFMAWPVDAELDATLQTMPYLDEFGQVRAVDWPGKVNSIQGIRQGLNREFRSAKSQANQRRLSQYGGWLDGPGLEATGHFRTHKWDGKWWLVDPEGYLFFSVGVSLAGHKSETPLNERRMDANFFAYVPGSDDYLRWAGRMKHREKEMLNFSAMNYQRALGKDWKARSRDGIHHRLRAWGINTLGAWADEDLQKDSRTPYSLIASVWWRRGYGAFPTPFEASFEDDLRATLQKLSWAKDDPYCLGVFIGNELGWPDNSKFTQKIFQLGEDDLTKQWVLQKLQKKYASISELNRAWGTQLENWSQLLQKEIDPIPVAAKKDIEPLYQEFASIYFAKCKKVMREVMPEKLYLGCRTVRSVNALGRAAMDHVDVFSANAYEARIRPREIPVEVDIPILVSEFHFGAANRGVPSPGLSAAWDQRQRGLAFTQYLASALADPRFVGVHWFQWIDQSAAGRWDRENHQIGFVDITGQAYPEFVDAVSRATESMYSARNSNRSTEQILETLIDPKQAR